MVKYKVIFEFRNDLGEWVEDYLDGNGEGLCEDDAVQLVRELRCQGKRNVGYEEIDVEPVMTVRELLEIEDISVDVCDDYDERCYTAFEYGYKLTTAGIDRFGAALDIPVRRVGNFSAVLHCETEEEAQACADLFYAIAGYCGYNDFDRWFKEV